MFESLYRYLILNHKLSLPGIGQIELERKPAVADFVNKQIKAPAYTMVMQPDADSPVAGFYKWLGAQFGISERESIIRFNDFLFDLKKQLNEGAVIDWKAVGELKKGLNGTVKFSPYSIEVSEKAVTAEKIIRDKPTHTVRVGEDEKTAAEMQEILAEPVKTKSRWWIAPLIVAVLTLAFLFWYFTKNELDVAGVGNQLPLQSR